MFAAYICGTVPAFLGALGALGGSIIVLSFLASWRLGGLAAILLPAD
jgi:hypothetical protein